MEGGATTPSASAWHSTSRKEHLEDVVRVHATHATSHTPLIDLFQVSSIIVHLTLFGVGKYRVCLANVLEFRLGFLLLFWCTVGMLVWMPHDCSLTVGFLDCTVPIAFINTKDLVIVFTLTLFEFELGSPQFLA